MSLKNKSDYAHKSCVSRFAAKATALIMAVSVLMGASVCSAKYFTDDTVITTVSSLGLMPYADDIKTETVTRAQMVISVLNFMGAGKSVPEKASEYTFDDVDYSKSDSAYIQFAYNIKLVSGVSETEFAPDSPATLTQAIKLMVTALGYDVVAQTRGGYPSGYISVASERGLLKGIDSDKSAELSAMDFARLMYNGLNTPVFKRNLYGEDNTYKKSSSAISEFLDFDEYEGIIEETSDVNIYGSPVKSAKNQICVGERRFTVGDSNIEDYLGYTVKVYFKEENGVAPEIAFFVLDNFNETLTLECDDVSTMTWDGDGIKLTYFNDNNRQRNEKTTAEAYLYNGYDVSTSQMQSVIIPKLSAKDDWSVTLIDNDLDGKYEVVDIQDSVSYHVKRVNSYSKLVYYYDYANLDLPRFLDFNITDEEDDYSIFASDGAELKFDELLPDTVITVYENLDSTHRKIVVSDETVSGKVTSLTTDGKCVIDDTKYYEVSDDLKNKILGEEGVFYLNIYGKIVGKDTTTDANGGYGLLMDVSIPNRDKLSSYPAMRILTSDGEITDFQAENEIMAYNPNTGKFQKTDFRSLVNNDPTPSGYDRVHDYMIWHTQNQANFTYDTKYNDYTKEFYYRPWLSDKDKSDIASRKPIYYKLSKDGRISTVIVPNIPTEENKLTLLNDDSRYTFTYNTSASLAIDSGANSSGDVPHYRVAKDATVFSCLALDYSLQDYSVPTAGMSIIPNGSYRKMKLYSLDDSDNEAQLVVAYSYLPYENTSSMRYVVVDKVLRDIDDNITLYGFSQGQEYIANIKKDTRLVERIFNSSNTEYNSSTKVTASNILNYIGYAYGGSGLAPYDISTSTSSALLEHPSLSIGSKTPYVDETSLKRGDIILVGKNKTDDVCYVEMAMRASDGVMLIPHSQDDWDGRMNSSSSYFKGVVTSVSGKETVYLRVIGEYNGSNGRKTTEGPNYRATAFFDDRNVPYDFTTCKSVWVYDYDRNIIEVIDGYSIEPGDVIMGRGSITSQNDCIILKNYPCEPDFSYWQ